MNEKKGYRGYCTHNSFGEYKIPVPAQNIIYRDYANKQNLELKLSVNELYFQDCFLQLESLLTELENLQGILMCSIYMLPENQKYRKIIYQKILNNNCELHFVLENLIMQRSADVNFIEQIFTVRKNILSTEIEEIKNYLI